MYLYPFVRRNVILIMVSTEWLSLLVHTEILLSRCQLFDPLVTHLFTTPRYIYILLILLILLFVRASIFFLVAPIDMFTLTSILFYATWQWVSGSWRAPNRGRRSPISHPPPRNVHVCLAFFEKVIVPPCSIVNPLICWHWHIYCFMQLDSEWVVLEYHPIRVVSHPPPPQCTCMYQFLWKSHCPSM